MEGIMAWLTGLVALIVPGFGADQAPSYNGYVEARYVYAAASTSGPIETISVKEGDQVLVGDLLFRLRQEQQIALLQAAEARVVAAKANLQNLTTGGREDEIDVARASLQKAEADHSLARQTAERSGQLFEQGLIPKSRHDQDEAALASAEAAVKQLAAQLKVAELPARDAQQQQAEANLTAAQADAEKASSELADRTITAPVAGRIERVFFDPGEMVSAGTPVLSILPEGALKVKFYLPEAARTGFTLGEQVGVSCDGCPDGLTARLTYFASEPQFTPPVIYSRDERQRLTFLVEATLDAASLHPGQPVTVGKLQ